MSIPVALLVALLPLSIEQAAPPAPETAPRTGSTTAPATNPTTAPRRIAVQTIPGHRLDELDDDSVDENRPQREREQVRERELERYRRVDDRRRGPDGRADEIMRRGPRLEPVESGVADHGPLTEGLRIVQPDPLAAPIGFERLFRIDTAGGKRFVRGDGGLFAVYPRGAYRYVKQKKAVMPIIPASTIFYIGRPEEWTLPPQSADPPPVGMIQSRIDASIGQRREDGKIDLRLTQPPDASLAAPPSAPAGARAEAMPPREHLPPIVCDENYRREFFAKLRARRAARPRQARVRVE